MDAEVRSEFVNLIADKKVRLGLVWEMLESGVTAHETSERLRLTTRKVDDYINCRNLVVGGVYPEWDGEAGRLYGIIEEAQLQLEGLISAALKSLLNDFKRQLLQVCSQPLEWLPGGFHWQHLVAREVDSLESLTIGYINHRPDLWTETGKYRTLVKEARAVAENFIAAQENVTMEFLKAQIHLTQIGYGTASSSSETPFPWSQ